MIRPAAWQRASEDLRRKIVVLEATVKEHRAAEVEHAAQIGMAQAAERELRKALQKAEAAAVEARQSTEGELVRCEAQRESEARAHEERAAQWEVKLSSFLEMSQQRGMDLRTFVANEPIYLALKASLAEEVSHARSYAERSRATDEERYLEQVNLLNARVASLERANSELRALKGTASLEAKAVGVAGYEARVATLERELELQRAVSAEAEERADERERWAEEQVRRPWC